jgi:hypothetical protein
VSSPTSPTAMPARVWCGTHGEGLGVKLSNDHPCRAHCSLRGRVDPPHDGVRRRWRFNVAIAVALSDARTKSVELTIAIVPAGTSFPAVWQELGNARARQQSPSSTN